MKACASAPGKVILFGEHFVVYDKPALVSAINLRAYAEVEKSDRGIVLDGWTEENPAVKASAYIAKELEYSGGINLRIRSSIPQSVGLGSSASVSVASAAATSLLLKGELDLELIMEAAHIGESLIHYRPSGIDTTIATYGGGGIYIRSKGFKNLSFDLNEILIINTGKARRTGDLVKKVKEFKDTHVEEFERILGNAERIIWEAVDALKNGDVELIGKLMLRNQELLRRVGVSSKEIEDVIELCMKYGALGAKLTGAGGGGCVIAVAEEGKLDLLMENMSKSFEVMRCRLMAEGVREDSFPKSP
ncbi:MAG: mevalonate kinase [Thaumarchaeota archaeon]|nr:MAG: mevalonate kinase [Nitrososphaerota archaeon]